MEKWKLVHDPFLRRATREFLPFQSHVSLIVISALGCDLREARPLFFNMAAPALAFDELESPLETKDPRGSLRRKSKGVMKPFPQMLAAPPNLSSKLLNRNASVLPRETSPRPCQLWRWNYRMQRSQKYFVKNRKPPLPRFGIH